MRSILCLPTASGCQLCIAATSARRRFLGSSQASKNARPRVNATLFWYRWLCPLRNLLHRTAETCIGVHERRFRDVGSASALPSRLTVTADVPDRQLGATDLGHYQGRYRRACRDRRAWCDQGSGQTWKTSFDAADGVAMWRRRGNWDARGPSGDLIERVCRQLACARCSGVVRIVVGLAHDLLHQAQRTGPPVAGADTLARCPPHRCEPAHRLHLNRTSRDGRHKMSDLGAVGGRVHKGAERVAPMCPRPATGWAVRRFDGDSE